MADIYESWAESDDRRFLADILSVLAMTYYDGTKRDSLRYRLLGSNEPVGSWGHEYVRLVWGCAKRLLVGRNWSDRRLLLFKDTLRWRA